jgi:hypothetical protein
VAEVAANLGLMGLKVNATAGDELPAGDPRIMTVYAANPLGQVDKGTTIDLAYYVQATITPSPTPTDSSTPTPSETAN